MQSHQIKLKIGMVTNQDTRNQKIMLLKLKNNGKIGLLTPKIDPRRTEIKSHWIELKIGTGIKIMASKSKMMDPKTENNGKMGLLTSKIDPRHTKNKR